jgi:hypothetical protein
MGQPIPVNRGYHPSNGWGALGELKHLSTLRNREDSRSSGERNGRSPNPGSVSSRCALLSGGSTTGPERGTDRSLGPHLSTERHWNGRPQGVRVP